MRMIRALLASGCILSSVLLNAGLAVTQGVHQYGPTGFQPLLELKDGDRVVFLGNSLFENDLPFGYMEFALATRWMEGNITFRNLGWSGDTVFGEARSYFTSPPTPYELMMEQLSEANPTVVFVAYGAIEAAEGMEGLPKFKQGLGQLLDKIEELGARAVLMSTLPQFPSEFRVDLEKHNANLKLYSSEIEKMAGERNLVFLDIFKPMEALSAEHHISENGIHLNELGYYFLAGVTEQGLGYPPREWEVTIGVSQPEVKANFPVELLGVEKRTNSFSFVTDEALLPLPLPKAMDRGDLKTPILYIKGLKRGYYQLESDHRPVASSSAKNWGKGVEMLYFPSFSQADQLRALIVKKNEMFFQRYRPLNRTYIIGFRSYEQGRHIKGLEDLDAIVQWIEGQIDAIRMPKTLTYSLSPIQ